MGKGAKSQHLENTKVGLRRLENIHTWYTLVEEFDDFWETEESSDGNCASFDVTARHVGPGPVGYRYNPVANVFHDLETLELDT